MDLTYRQKENRRRVAKNQAILVALKDVPCHDCEHRFPHYVMEFDHRGDDKAMNVSKAVVKGTAVMLAEAAKCDIVCANCHNVRSYYRRQRVSEE